jgi:hypothetical protein
MNLPRPSAFWSVAPIDDCHADIVAHVSRRRSLLATSIHRFELSVSAPLCNAGASNASDEQCPAQTARKGNHGLETKVRIDIQG